MMARLVGEIGRGAPPKTEWTDPEEARSAMAGTHIIGRAILSIVALLLVALIVRILT